MILDMSWSWLFRGGKRRLGRENQVRTVLDSVPLLEEVDGAVLVEKGGTYETTFFAWHGGEIRVSGIPKMEHKQCPTA